MIFKRVLDGKPYPDHQLDARAWSQIPPRQVRLADIVTITRVLELERLLTEDSTFYGDLFPHVVVWEDDMFLEDGLHRAVRSALRNRMVLHARVFDFNSTPDQHCDDGHSSVDLGETECDSYSSRAQIKLDESAAPHEARRSARPRPPASGRLPLGRLPGFKPRARAPRHRLIDDPDQ